VDGGYLVRLAIRLGVVEVVELSECIVYGCLEGWWILDPLMK